MLTFCKTPRRKITSLGARREWYSKCKQYRVYESLATRSYYSQRLEHVVLNGGREIDQWHNISSHRTKAAAEKACCQHAKGSA